MGDSPVSRQTGGNGFVGVVKGTTAVVDISVGRDESKIHQHVKQDTNGKGRISLEAEQETDGKGRSYLEAKQEGASEGSKGGSPLEVRKGNWHKQNSAGH